MEDFIPGVPQLVQADADDCRDLYGVGRFDAALCQGVVMYLPSTEPIVEMLASLVRPGGIVSLSAKNGDALAMRAALERRYADAIALFENRCVADWLCSAERVG